MLKLINRAGMAKKYGLSVGVINKRINLLTGNWLGFPLPVETIGLTHFYDELVADKFIKVKAKEALLTNKKTRLEVRENKRKIKRKKAKIAREVLRKKALALQEKSKSLEYCNMREIARDLAKLRKRPVIEYKDLALLSIQFHTRSVMANRTVSIDQIRSAV